MNVVENQSWREEGKEYDITEIEKEDEPYSHTKFKPEVIPFCWQCFESETWAILCHSREQVLQNMRNVTYHFPAVPGRHPCSHRRPCRHSRGWVGNQRDLCQGQGLCGMDQEPHPRARPEDQEDSSGATGGDGWVQRSEGVSGYPRQTPLTPMTMPPGQHHWSGRIQPTGWVGPM